MPHPDPPKAVLKILMDKYSKRRFRECINIVEDLLKKYPDSVVLLNIAGSSNLGLSNYDEADSALKRSIKINPNHPPTYDSLGSLYKAQGRLNDAVNAFKHAIKLDPKFYVAFNNLGNSLRIQGKLFEAICSYKKALKINPGFIIALINLGDTYQEIKQYRDAIDAYQNVIKLNCAHALAWNNMANALRSIGDLSSAFHAYSKALQIDPNYVNPVENLHYLHLQIKSCSEPFCEKLPVHDARLNLSRPKLLIQSALKNFIDFELTECSHKLAEYKNLPSREKLGLDSKSQVYCSAYYSFLHRLIPQLTGHEIQINSKKIYHIGDSHCLSYAHQVVSIKGSHYQVEPRIVFGAKAFHFTTSQPNEFSETASINFKSLPQNSVVFLSFGEIDCRVNEGFIPASLKRGISINALIDETIDKYISFFSHLNVDCAHSIYFINVPAPVYVASQNEYTNELVSSVIKYFNFALERFVASTPHQVLDVYTITSDDNGFSNGNFHLDNYHLRPNTIKELARQLSG